MTDDVVRSMTFFVPMLPRQKGNHKKIVHFGKRAALINDAKTREAEQGLVARLLEHCPEDPLEGPVRLSVYFVLPVPESWPEWKRAAALGGRFWPVSRPDRGNLLKLLEDAMTGIFYVDDARVVDGVVGKRYGAVAGYSVVLDELFQATRESERAACP